ncbi:unnamed protein product [Phyllotreta striolata]|uniref:Uncharacterized protein n=1 Tax=Phyllotreta striolata TaxID=444603 RepID=A0A9N9TSR1_PHYSR|nr:unnamed protein product [Phyllotreta striolata]
MCFDNNDKCCDDNNCCSDCKGDASLDSFNCFFGLILFWLTLLAAHACAFLHVHLHFTGNCQDFSTFSVVVTAAAMLSCILSLALLIMQLLCCDQGGCFCLLLVSGFHIFLGSTLMAASVFELTQSTGLLATAAKLGIATGALQLLSGLLPKLLFSYCCCPDDTNQIPCCCPPPNCC